ncbi:hypothetical protein DUI87_29152 [Hirundo rustica rustica]|uniref:Uncharacterized protein n=1 Tax=Hirundo rustica rustica TaxID=333673 RepID=A0A3M0J0V0_HIRRU|nr:hypothetical protein DUI87_29152 [Hirundo rustica rustica]
MSVSAEPRFQQEINGPWAGGSLSRMKQKESLGNGGILKKNNGIYCNSPWHKGDEQKHYAGRNMLKDCSLQCPTNTHILSFMKSSTGLLSIAEEIRGCLRLSMNFLFQYCAKCLVFEDIIKNTSKFLCLTHCCFQELLEGKSVMDTVDKGQHALHNGALYVVQFIVPLIQFIAAFFHTKLMLGFKCSP